MNLVVKYVKDHCHSVSSDVLDSRITCDFFYLFVRMFLYLHITFRPQLYCNSFIQQLHNSCVSAQTCITRQLLIPLGWRNLWKNVHLTIERQEQAAQNQEEDGLQKLPMRCCKNKIFMREQRSVCVWQLWGSVQQKKQKGFTGVQLFLFQVVMLAMYNLSLEGTGRQGYFRWKEDICAFIEKHWTFLLGNR